MNLIDVGRHLGLDLPAPPGRCFCPFTKHRRDDKTFRTFKSRSGDDLWICWSCDEPNKGDAVGLYAKMRGVDRREAWKQLKEAGLVGEADMAPRPVFRAEKKPETPLSGIQHAEVLPLDIAVWNRWSSARVGNVEAFAEKRKIGADTMREHGVIDMAGACIGFTYVDPSTGAPCRVKVRGVEQKKFFVEPFIKGSNAKAAAPLYLANELTQVGQAIRPVIIVEGEVDALSLVHLGFKNVVSLPDGAESAKTVDLSPLYPMFNVWISALDWEDARDPKWKGKAPPGLAGHRVLVERARPLGVDTVRCIWTMLVGEEMVTYKDANDALKDGRNRDDFARCLDLAMTERFGYTCPW